LHSDIPLPLLLFLKKIALASNVFILDIETDKNPSLCANLPRLPQSLPESLEALKKDSVLEDLIGEKLLVAIKGVRKVCLRRSFRMMMLNLLTKNLNKILEFLISQAQFGMEIRESYFIS
jgi:hypothetical protein